MIIEQIGNEFYIVAEKPLTCKGSETNKRELKDAYLTGVLEVKALAVTEHGILDNFYSTAERISDPGRGKERPKAYSVNMGTKEDSNVSEGGGPSTIEGINNSVFRTLRDFHSETARTGKEPTAPAEVDTLLHPLEPVEVFGTKYKPVGVKVRPILAELPQKFRIERHITGNPLAGMPVLDPRPPDFEPTGRYTQERKDAVDKKHAGEFLWAEERKLLHSFIMKHNSGFAWDDSERGEFKEEFFPAVEFPLVEHIPWVLKSIPITPGDYDEICDIIRKKIASGVYEPSNSSYRSRWFCVRKSDGRKRIVHSLEPLNAVTIQHSGLPPATDALAEHFAGRSCIGALDLFVGFDNRNIHENSRDYTTFQTPFGALRLVKLPMGWTNSVPIFHDDVNYILKDEVPHVTIPYIDDVPVRGPKTRYETDDGGYQTIPENEGIRRFVWEHFQNLNRILQRMRYAGGTFSGTKSILCGDDVPVVGHRCTYEGRKPSEERIRVLEEWGPVKDVSNLKSFLGICNVMRMFIKDYSRLADPLQRLLKKDVPWEWGPTQVKSAKDLTDAIRASPALRPISYEWPTPVVLAVDTSYIAVGYYIYQCDPEDPKKRYYARFGSISLDDRQARFSQPKRELFGLKVSLKAGEYWLIGSRKLEVETDAKYLKGMLVNPGRGPNATINRWIEEILMFHFTLRHVKGVSFPADHLSRKAPSSGDTPMPEDDRIVDEETGLQHFVKDNEGDDDPLEFEDYKSEIDTRGGYYTQLAKSVEDFEDDMDIAQAKELALVSEMKSQGVIAQYLHESTDVAVSRWDMQKDEPYNLVPRTPWGLSEDIRTERFKSWLSSPELQYARSVEDKERLAFKRWRANFFLDQDKRLYRRGPGREHKLFVSQEKRMYMLRAGHDSVAHKGFYATNDLLRKRFWWPELEKDVAWYVKTCTICQNRQKTQIRIPPSVTDTPNLFQVLHVDTMQMSPPSNGCKYILHGRCGLSHWPEARAVQKETTRVIALWLLEDWVCRWGCPVTIQTDNAPQWKAAATYLEDKYGIRNIQVSPYNHRAAGKIERPHWDIRQALIKATGGNPSKWFPFLPYVLWADRTTVKRGLGCAPYFVVTGGEPTLPLDILEATWLVQFPDRTLTTAEVVGYRAQALAKHPQVIERVKQRIDKVKRDNTLRYEREHAATIKDYKFEPGDLVLVRNTQVEQNLDRKMQLRYIGPLVVIKRTKGCTYIVAELDGSIWQKKIARFRVIPYHARRSIELPKSIHDFIDMSQDALEDLVTEEPEDSEEEKVNEPIWEKVRLKGSDDTDSDTESLQSDEEEDNSAVTHQNEDVDEEKSTGPRRSKRLGP